MRYLFGITCDGMNFDEIEVVPREDTVVIKLISPADRPEEMEMSIEEAGEFESYFGDCLRQAESNFNEMQKNMEKNNDG